MKRLFLVIAIFLAFALLATAAPAQPVRTYEAEKARLIAAGYEPAKMRRASGPQREICVDGFCDTHPEVNDCYGGRCTFVFKRPSDLAILLVITTKDVGRVLAVRPPGNQDSPDWAYLDQSAPLYDQVRAQLIAQGYRPVPLRLPRDDETFGVTVPLYHKLYPETLDCSGTGRGGCTMAYVRVRTGTYMTLRVYGEVPADVSAPYPIAPARDLEIEDIKSRLVRPKK